MKRIRQTNRYRRSGFTLIEMLVAAAVAAFITAAAATMINGIANASTNAAEYRAAKSEGMASMQRITKEIRSARAIGEVTAESVILWNADENNNDKIDDLELKKIHYDSADKAIKLTTLDPGVLAPDGLDTGTDGIMNTGLTAFDLLASIRGDTQTIAENVEQFSISGYPDSTDARIVNFSFEKPMTDDKLVFRDAASPRAPADYLFVDEAKVMDVDSGRWVRKEESRWTGFSDLKGETIVFPN